MPIRPVLSLISRSPPDPASLNRGRDVPSSVARAFRVGCQCENPIRETFISVRHTGPVQDFKAHLVEQLDFLRASMDAYDAGREHEAKRLSVAIRTLVHNTRTSTSLLRHLGVQNQMGWVDRGPPAPPPKAIVLSFGVCVVETRFDTRRTRYEPAMRHLAPDRLHPPVSFLDWWRRTILVDQRGNTFSRADLVLAVADQDGGAHIDAALNEKYRQLSRENSLGFRQSHELPIANSVVQTSVRHIAEELLETVASGVAWQGERAVIRDPVCPLPLDTHMTQRRNDPCPCESGRKVKHCFGSRIPLCVMAQPPEKSQPGQAHPIPGPQPTPEPHAPPGFVLDCLLLVPIS